MKKTLKYIGLIALLGALGIASVQVQKVSATPANTQSATSTDPFAQMDKIFAVQMQEMRRMQQQMDAMFQNFGQNFQTPALMQTPHLIHSSGVLSSGFQDKGDHYTLTIRVHDLKNAKVNITAENGMLTVTTQSQNKQEQTKGNYGKVISFASSSSTQSFTLPPDADAATIKAEQKDNTITITLKKKKGAASKAKVIPIQKKDGNTTK